MRFLSRLTLQSMPNVYLSHEVFSKSSAWAITPVLIDILNQLIKPHTKWLVMCEASSMVNLGKLLTNLEAEDETNVSTKLILKLFGECLKYFISQVSGWEIFGWKQNSNFSLSSKSENALKTFFRFGNSCRKFTWDFLCLIEMQQLSITLLSSTIHQLFIILTCEQVLRFPFRFLTGNLSQTLLPLKDK